MANLNFKWGLQNKIPTYTSETVGTVYVTTDSRAMFIDTTTERIRLQGSVIYCNHLSDLNPPYEEDVLYFVRTIDDVESGPKATKVVNALLAYNNGAWVQINPDAGEFAAVKEQLLSLQEKVTGFETSLSTLDDAINNPTKGINQQISGIVSILTGLVALEEDVEKNTTAIEGLTESMGDVKTRLSGAETNITTLTTDKASKTELEAIDTKKLDKSVYEGEKTSFATKADVARDYVLSSTYSARQSEIDLALSNLDSSKATKQELTDGLTGKVSQSTYDAEKANFATKSEVGAKLDESKFNTYKTETATTLSNLASTKANVSALDGKLDISTYNTDKANFVTKSELGNKLDESAFNTYKSTTDAALSSLGTDKADKSELETLKTTLEADIDEEIRTANSLHYIAGITKKADLPSTNVKIGDVYVLTERDTSCEGAPGDLFIAKGTEDETSGIITTGLTWDHIKTGYDETLNHSLARVTEDNNNRMILTTFG